MSQPHVARTQPAYGQGVHTELSLCQPAPCGLQTSCSHWHPDPTARRCHRDWSPASHLNSGGCGLRFPQRLQASAGLAKPVHASAFCWADLPFSSEILPSSNFVLTWLFSCCSKISYRISLYVTVTLFSSLTLLYVKFLLLKLLWGFSLLTGPKLPSSLNVWYFKRQDFEALWCL